MEKKKQTHTSLPEMLQLQKFVRRGVCNKRHQQPCILPVQIVLLCISFTAFGTESEGSHNTELQTKTWDLFPCFCWKYLSVSSEEDFRHGTNAEVTNFASASEKGRTIRETHALKQNWPNARPRLQDLLWVCGYRSFRFTLRFKITQHPAAAFFSVLRQGPDKVGTPKGRTYTQTKPVALLQQKILFGKRVYMYLVRSGRRKVLWES